MRHQQLPHAASGHGRTSRLERRGAFHVLEAYTTVGHCASPCDCVVSKWVSLRCHMCLQGLYDRRCELETRATRTGRWALSDRQVEGIIGEIKTIDEQLDAREVWREWIATKRYRACGPLRTKLEFERSFASLPARMISALRTMTVFLRMRPVCWTIGDEVRSTIRNGTD